MSFDWSQYRGNLTWLPAHTIFLTQAGSHAYGTNIASSDMDIRGIAIAPRNYYLGFLEVFEQAESKEPDFVVFELKKFMKLATEANPNVLELLWTAPENHLVVTTAAETLIANRELFLSQKAKHTFSGYAMSQLKRINIHYKWLKHPPKAPPLRQEFGLPERTVIPADQLEAAKAAVRKQVDRWAWHEMEHVEPALRQSLQDEFTRRLAEITKWSWDQTGDKVWEAAAREIGIDTNFIELLDKERRYTSKQQEWRSFTEWQKTRNPARAEIEAKFGYDTKHAMHLIRLMRMCREILTEGQVIVRRPDAEELLEIRNGSWTYEQLIEWAAVRDEELTQLAKVSKLPKQPNRNRITQLCIELVEASLTTYP
jgi:hypothetical protein